MEWFESDQLPWPDTLEPTTKVLWNVRPTTLVGHPSRSSGVCCFPRLSWQLVGLERATRFLRKAVRVRPAHHVGHSSSASVSAETTFYWACHFRFSLARKFPFVEIEKPIAETQEAEDEMLPSPFGGILAARRRVAVPGARLERGIKLRINRPSRWVNRWRGFGVVAPIRWADHTGGRSPSRAADAHRLRL